MVVLARHVEKLKLSLKDDPHGTDKVFPKKFVQRLYDPLVSKTEVSKILEIGVRGGASLRMWSEYLKGVPGGLIVGIDDFSDVTKPRKDWLEESNIQVIEGNAYDPKIVAKFSEKFDLIVDDGPHDLQSQILFLELYRSLLSEDGFLVVEDILGGVADLARLIRSMPSELSVCVWSVDIRRESNCEDALLLVVHNCRQPSEACSPSEFARSENQPGRATFRTTALAISWVRRYASKARNFFRHLRSMVRSGD